MECQTCKGEGEIHNHPTHKTKKIEYYRTVCTCYFGGLCGTTHKTWAEFEADIDLIKYCKKHFGTYIV